MIMRVFESDYNRKQSWINLKICYKTHIFSCDCLRARDFFIPLYRSWETAHDFDF